MINVIKQNGKLIGQYRRFLDKTLYRLNDYDYLMSEIIKQLEQDEKSDLFTYGNFNVTEMYTDFFGTSYFVQFEFIPNKELLEELKIVAERLQIGL
jgi:hypothetical protein